MNLQKLYAIDEIDAYPGPGAFLSTRDKVEYKVYGVVVQAFNFMHAEYLACKQLVEASGGEWVRCALCNQPLRWLVLCRDEESGLHHILGRDCAATLDAGLPTQSWDTKRKLRDIKEVQTKNGVRYIHKREVPSWFWKLQRPSYVSVSAWERMVGRRKVKTWYLTIWGEGVDEVLSNIEALEKMEHST
jgi:hypothetical protein